MFQSLAIKIISLTAVSVFFLVIFLFYGNPNYSKQPSVKDSSLSQKYKELSVVIYTKAQCVYCAMAKDFLEQNGIFFTNIDINNNDDIRTKLISKTGQTTVPYIFINDHFIGGFNELSEIDFSNPDNLNKFQIDSPEK